jgi:dihydrofolate synthase / folylpolyglutamate synthase
MRSLDQWLAYQTQLHPQAIDLSLERLRAVLKQLDWQPPSVPLITIGGTNGKGSVAAFCTSILSAAGYRVGTFTSPHLRDYRERIRVHDRLVSADELIGAFEKIEAARGSIGLTFFEFNALAALLVFEASALDAWVLEVGMGGRLDAVNVVDPDVAVVVSIGLDHQEYLGDTLDAIAMEKAGIFRPGRPAVLGGRAPSLVLENAARDMGAALKRPSIEYNFILEGEGWRYRGSRWELPLLPAPALKGQIQFGNAACALAALEELDGRLKIPADAVERGLRAVRLTGRFQVIEPNDGSATWILDVAHNPDAAHVLVRNLYAAPPKGRTLAVCGILADKDAAAITAALRECVDAWWCASLDGARGRSGEALAQVVSPLVAVPVAYSVDVAAACAAASAAAAPSDRILVFGSFHTVGPALDWLEARGLLSEDALAQSTTPRPG